MFRKRKQPKRKRKPLQQEVQEEEEQEQVLEQLEVKKLEQRLRKKGKGLGASTLDASQEAAQVSSQEGELQGVFEGETHRTALDEAMESFIQEQIERKRRGEELQVAQHQEEAPQQQQQQQVAEKAEAPSVIGTRNWAARTQHVVQEVDLGDAERERAERATLEAVQRAEAEGRELNLGGEAADRQALKAYKTRFFATHK